MSERFDLMVIGGGPAGYLAAERASREGMRVILFERRALGGVCLNEGCIPSKALLNSAKLYEHALHSAQYGVHCGEVRLDQQAVTVRRGRVVRTLVNGVKAKLRAAGVTVVMQEAKLDGRDGDCLRVTAGGEVYLGKRLLIASGSTAIVPPIPGVRENLGGFVLTNREVLELTEIPNRLIVVGGGVIGLEMAAYYAMAGAKVTVVEMLDEILGGMDKELSALLRAEYAKRGIKFLLSTKVVGLSQTEEGAVVSYENAEGNGSVIAEKLLMSVGRRPVTKGFGLENLNLEQTERGAIRVNEKMQTSVPDVYVCGDLTGFSLLAHTAVREAEVAVHSILGKEDAMSYRAIPGVVYTNPEIAGVGETEESALAKGITYQVIKFPMAYSGRFVAENEGVNGVCKVLLDEQQRVIGAHVLGNPASEIITLAGTAIELGLTAAQWKKIVFPHPTVGEIFREVL